MERQPSFAARPRIAHITNHGYGGPHVITGGAPDTGGQNVYVNAATRAMAELGFHVTVFARGGFPHFGSDRVREGIEPFGENARYVYVPGGGDGFIRKEDIATALDEEVDWLEAFVAAEAGNLGCRPWQVYSAVVTHYWDAGVIGRELRERWRSLRAAEILADILEGVLDVDEISQIRATGGHGARGEAFDFHLGSRLLDTTDALLPPESRVETAVRSWCDRRAPDLAGEAVADALHRLAATGHPEPALAALAAADAVGAAVSAASGTDVAAELRACGRHVFTPHSLAVLKEENTRDKPIEVRRDLRFCERRDHELAVCRTADAVAATSAEIAEQLHTRLGVPSDRMFFFPPGVDRSLFRPYAGEAVNRTYAWLEATTGVDEGSLRRALLVYETSRMDRTKRKDLLFGAFARVAREIDDVYLVIGGGPENDLFRELRAIRDADPILARRAFLLGFVPDEVMHPLFSMADVFASASEMEGFGMSVAQAAAAGTPIVASHLIPFAVNHVPEDAVIFRAGDERAFASGIAGLLRSPGERERRGERLRELTCSLDWVGRSAALFDHLRHLGMDIARPPESAGVLPGGQGGDR